MTPDVVELEEALLLFVDVFERVVATSMNEEGGLARRLYEYGVDSDLLAAVMALRWAPDLIEEREALAALEEEALSLPWDTFPICMLALPWSKVVEFIQHEETGALLKLLEDTHDLFNRARRHGFGSGKKHASPLGERSPMNAGSMAKPFLNDADTGLLSTSRQGSSSACVMISVFCSGAASRVEVHPERQVVRQSACMASGCI